MTPAARYAAAIDLLDDVLAGQPAEKALTTWARQNRFAGSKDRAAIRDHVYDILRAQRSLAAIGGAMTGRGLVLGLLRRDGIAPETVFGSGGYGPAGLTDDEAQQGAAPASDAEAVDIPDWLWPLWTASLGDAAQDVAKLMQSRAPIALRVNLRHGTRAAAQFQLAAEGIETAIAADVATGLIVQANPRRVAGSKAFQDGLIELQDLASQQAAARLQVPAGGRVLDYCAGGGGKALALADLCDAQVFAHDIAANRMRDIGPRAARAGVQITQATTQELAGHGLFDLVLCDAPCSGSGTWRRTPEAKWALTADKLNNYNDMQAEVLTSAQGLVAPGGQLAYATCSVLRPENDDVLAAFCDRYPAWQIKDVWRLTPTHLNDGFFLAILTRKNGS